jgi:hypothetical protein
MSAEVERLFSSVKLVISDNQSCLEPESIESGECIKSWVGAKLFFLMIILTTYHMTGCCESI